MKKVLIVGDIDITTSAKIYNFPLRVEDEIIYIPNGTRDIVGGSVLNIGLPLKDWGFDVEIISNIGNDMYENPIYNVLQKNNISTKYVSKPYKNTMRSIILVNKNGDKLILQDSKDAMTLKIDTSKYKELFEQTNFAHICVFNWARQLLPELTARNIMIGTDIHTNFDIYGYHRDFIKNSHIVFFSQKGIASSFRDSMYKIRHLGPEIVVCTAGADGCYILEKEKIRHFPALRFSGKIVDTTGAGDNFAAGFYAELLKGNSIEKSVLTGQVAALYSCGFNGTSRYIHCKELDKLKITVQKSGIILL